MSGAGPLTDFRQLISVDKTSNPEIASLWARPARLKKLGNRFVVVDGVGAAIAR